MKKLLCVMGFILISFLWSQELIVNLNADHNNIKSVIVVGVEQNSIIKTNAIAKWEKELLKNGYDVIKRDKIDILIDEKALKLSGFTKEKIQY